jgi:hypothetical protein
MSGWFAGSPLSGSCPGLGRPFASRGGVARGYGSADTVRLGASLQRVWHRRTEVPPSTRTPAACDRAAEGRVVLADDSRSLLTRGGFFNPSLDGGFPLVLLSSPRRRSNSAMRASCASKSTMSSSFENRLSKAASIESLNRPTLRQLLSAPRPPIGHEIWGPACFCSSMSRMEGWHATWVAAA